MLWTRFLMVAVALALLVPMLAIADDNGEEGGGGGKLVLKAIDAAKKSITVTVGKKEQSYEVAANATVTINGKPGKLEDLKAGSQVSLRMGADKKTVEGITTGGAKKGEGGEGGAKKKPEGDKEG
jgi:hypothetical protein